MSKDLRLIKIGTNHFVMAHRIVAVFVPEQNVVEGIIKEAKENGKLIPANGKIKVYSIVLFDTKHVILSFVKPEKMAEMLSGKITINGPVIDS